MATEQEPRQSRKSAASDLLWVLGGLFVAVLCAVNAHLEQALLLQVLWYIGSAVAVVAAGFSGYEAFKAWRLPHGARQAPQAGESLASQARDEHTQ